MRVSAIPSCLLSIIALFGCAHPQSAASPTAAQSAEAHPAAMPDLICPAVRQTNRKDATPFHEVAFTLNDGVLCSDGKYYCYANGQTPIPAPQNSVGYECTNLIDFDVDYRGSQFEELTTNIENEYPYCEGSDAAKVRISLMTKHILKWVCTDESCECGGQTCPRNSVCEKERCIPPTQIDWPDDAPICEHMDYRGYAWYSDPIPEDDDPNDIYCKDTTIQPRSNRICLAHPRGSLTYHRFCPDQPGASSGNSIQNVHIDEENQAISIAMNLSPSELRDKWFPMTAGDKTDTCQCGAQWCEAETACLNGTCVDIATLQPLPSNAYRGNYGRPLCSEPSCPCGTTQCRQNEYCIEGACFDTPDVMKVDGRYIRYGAYIFTGTDYYYDPNTYEALPRDHYQTLSEVMWLDIVTHRMSALCEDPVLPANIEDYICVLDNIDNACAEGAVDTIAFRGWHCAKDEGCACGDTTCSRHARCYHGQCLYDTVYLAMACNSDYTLWGHEGTKADERGWCLCGGSTVPPNMNGYQCLGNVGMSCHLNDGCDCGNARCKYLDYCVSPDNCADDIDAPPPEEDPEADDPEYDDTYDDDEASEDQP